MPFDKNNAKELGKKGGQASTKRNKQWDALHESIVGEHADRFNEELASLQGKEYVAAYTQVLKFFRPSLAQTTFDAGEDNVEFKIVIKGKKNAGS